MLKTIDQALAGAIDYVADDLTATVKSVREHGVKSTLVHAVEDAASLVKDGAGAMLGGIGGRKGPAPVSQHSGMSGGYADLVAGGRSSNYGGQPQFAYDGPSSRGGVPLPKNGGGAAFQYNGPGGAAAFPYVPNQPSRGGGASKAPPMVTGGFAPGIGIQRNSASAGAFAGAPAIQPYNGHNPYAGAGSFNPAAAPRPAQPPAPVPYTGAATSGQYNTSSAPAAPKGPNLDPQVIAAQFEKIKKDPANNICFDCGVQNPEWASVSFGIFVCIECSGFHRQMGTHISRIRSVKMDSWTQAAINIFDHGGNKRLGEFFAANGVPAASKFQRYVTPSAEWYREAWIKNRTLGRAVPPPAQGVNVGPCVDTSSSKGAAEKGQTAAAAPADLLDMGGGPAPKAAAPAADLLNMEGATSAKAAPVEADLLGVGSSAPSNGGDLLGLGEAGNPPASAGLLGLDLSAPAAAPAAAPAPAFDGDLSSLISAAQRKPEGQTMAAPNTAAAPAPLLQPQQQSQIPSASPSLAGFGAVPAANTLAGGAKLQEKEEPKEEDPFAMALNKWGM